MRAIARSSGGRPAHVSTATGAGDSLLPMSKPLIRLLAVAALVLSGATLTAGAAAASTAPPLPAVSAYGSGPNDFTFDSFDVVYDLGLTGDGRSTATVTETLVAQFPDIDQNHGILRVIPVVFQDHPLRVNVESVRDANGNDWNYESSVDDENITLQIGDGDRFLHGQQTFVITYTMENVTAYFANTNDDEFYWDTNGLQWAQPFGEVTATVNLQDGLAGVLESTDCYFGGPVRRTAARSPTGPTGR